jgi:hypothetical protein
VECLVQCGADLDIRGWRPAQSAREIAREMFESMSKDPARRRIAELCGMDPDAILADRAARPADPPSIEPKLAEALELAGDDALRLGQSETGPEHLLFGLLRSGGFPLDFFTRYSRMDLDRFRADVWTRVHPVECRIDGPTPPLAAEAQAAIQSAIAIATERRYTTVRGIHLLLALVRPEHGPAAKLLTRYGANAARMKEELERAV